MSKKLLFRAVILFNNQTKMQTSFLKPYSFNSVQQVPACIIVTITLAMYSVSIQFGVPSLPCFWVFFCFVFYFFYPRVPVAPFPSEVTTEQHLCPLHSLNGERKPTVLEISLHSSLAFILVLGVCLLSNSDRFHFPLSPSWDVVECRGSGGGGYHVRQIGSCSNLLQALK